MTVFWLNLEEVIKRLRRAVTRLAEKHPEILEVWLFGSLARGEAVPGSDADLLIILDKCTLPFLERSSHYQPDFCGVGVDVFAYTKEELARMESQGHMFPRTIKPEMQCLFQRSRPSQPG